MIDETVRDIVESELREGETLLWAEQIDSELRNKWIRKSIRDDRLWAFPFLIIGALILWGTFHGKPQPDAKTWLVNLGSIPLLIFGGLLLIAFTLTFRSFFGHSHYENRRPFIFYALTDIRLLYFGADNDLVLELDATKAKKAELLKRWSFPNKWNPLCLMLSPVGRGVWKMTELYFLPDFEKSKNQISSVIKAKDATP